MGETLRNTPELAPRNGVVVPVAKSFGVTALELGLAELPTEEEAQGRLPNGIPEIKSPEGQTEIESWMLLKFFPSELGITTLQDWNDIVTQPVQTKRAGIKKL